METNSGIRIAVNIHFNFRQNIAFVESLLAGRLRCIALQVQMNIVKRLLERRFKVPLLYGWGIQPWCVVSVFEFIFRWKEQRELGVLAHRKGTLGNEV